MYSCMYICICTSYMKEYLKWTELMVIVEIAIRVNNPNVFISFSNLLVSISTSVREDAYIRPFYKVWLFLYDFFRLENQFYIGNELPGNFFRYKGLFSTCTVFTTIGFDHDHDLLAHSDFAHTNILRHLCHPCTSFI